MIYRIKIMEDSKFVRYATDKEMKYLRVNSNGKVEELTNYDYMSDDEQKLVPKAEVFMTGEWVASDYYYSGECYSCWIDVSSTHEVEWGVVINGVSIYENDIVSTSIDRGDHEPFNDYLLVCLNGGEFFMRSLLANDGYLNFSIESTDKIIGNSNENPELLEEANG